VGRRGRRAGPHRRLSARPGQALRQAWPEDLMPVRAHRPWLRALANRLGLSHAGGGAQLPRLHGGRGRPDRELSRVALRGARGRPRPCRAAAQDVRPRARRGLPRVQGHLGSRRRDEPGQDRGPLSASPATRAALRRPPNAASGWVRAAIRTGSCARATR
jgi:hypothetical protein